MRVGVLGPLEVRAEGWQVDVAGPIPRRLLALLATRPGRFLSIDALIDGLWGDNPPAAARQTLQSHVARLRLRHSLGEPQVIVAGPAGYRLVVNAGDVDAFSFMAAAEDGHRALIGGDPAAAATVLSAGLALWRGPAFAEFTACAALDAEAARLEQLRLDAVEWRIEAELASGEPAPPVGELEALVREHPTREGLWALLMRALYRAGRQADALEAYRRARADGAPSSERSRFWTPARSTTRPSRLCAKPRPPTRATCGTSSVSPSCARQRRSDAVVPRRP